MHACGMYEFMHACMHTYIHTYMQTYRPSFFFPQAKTAVGNGQETTEDKESSANVQPAEEEKGTAKPKAKGKGAGAKAKGKEKQDGDPPREKSVLETEMAEMVKMRSRFMTATSRAESVINSVKSQCPDWSRADNSQNLGAVETNLKEVKDKCVEFRCQELILADVGGLKKRYEPAHLVGLCRGFLKLGEHVQKLEDIVSLVMRRHHAK